MRRLLTCLTVLAISTTPIAAKEGGAGFPVVKALGQRGPAADRLAAVQAGKGLAGAPGKGGPTCVEQTINCNSTVNGVLETTDCALGDNTFVDLWIFDGVAGDEVTIDLISSDFDTYLVLVDPTPLAVIDDDDGGNGTNSRIVYALDSSGEWTIAVNNLEAVTGDPGNYTLTLTCSNGVPTVPAAPSNLAAAASSSTTIDLFWQDNSNNEEDFEVQMRSGGNGFQTIGTVAANTTGAQVEGLEPETPYTFRVRARNAAGSSDFSNEATATTDPDNGPPPPGNCISSSTTLCLNEGRFEVRVDWRGFSGSGMGEVVQTSSDKSGFFFFFHRDNWEMLVKVLNGCPINDHFWVFAAATTNVEYTLRVTDTETGAVRQYFNPLGVSSPAITDTNAFATCP